MHRETSDALAICKDMRTNTERLQQASTQEIRDLQEKIKMFTTHKDVKAACKESETKVSFQIRDVDNKVDKLQIKVNNASAEVDRLFG